MPPVTNFQFLQNLAIARLGLNGSNFSGAPNNAPNDLDPPALVQGLINLGYNEFLSRTLESGIAVLKVSFLTTINAISFPLRPLPVSTDGITPNPAALRVLEGTYTQQAGLSNAGYEYRFPVVDEKTFRALAGDYTRRLTWFGPRVEYGSQLYGRPQLDIIPGCAISGDTINLTVVPDPQNAPNGLSAAMGGPLTNAADVPLFPAQFHMALVEYVVMNLGQNVDQPTDVAAAQKRWEQYVLDAQLFGSTYGDGYTSMNTLDTWANDALNWNSLP
jgi:hypothetical protein